MVYKLKPLEFTFEFEDRIYELGDTIDIELSLAPNGGRRCEGRWSRPRM